MGAGYSWSSDVWSLGCVLYELAMLKSPFKEEGLNLVALFHKITAVRAPSRSHLLRDCNGLESLSPSHPSAQPLLPPPHLRAGRVPTHC